MDRRPFYDLCSDFYDDDYEAIGRGGDVSLYVQLARQATGRSGGAVLEIGCGTGRVLLPTARAGVPVVGVDASPAMLDRLRRRLDDEREAVRQRVELTHADVRHLDLGRTFPLVTAPFRMAQHLLTRDDQRAWLRASARHLEPGGELVFDVFQTDYDYLADPPRSTVDVERTDAAGRRLRRLTTAVHTPEEQTFRLRVEWRIGDPDGDDYEEHGAETEVRWFTRAELENLLELEGFQVLDVWGSFDREPHGAGAEEIVMRARRPAAVPTGSRR